MATFATAHTSSRTSESQERKTDFPRLGGFLLPPVYPRCKLLRIPIAFPASLRNL